MFSRIMVPVDLAHTDKLGKSLKCAADLGRHYGIPVVYAGVTGTTPGPLGHTPEEFSSHLADFAESQGTKESVETGHHTIVSHDPRIDMDDKLVKAAAEIGADLIVMESHVPNVVDHVWPSNGGTVAAHSKATVMVVRD